MESSVSRAADRLPGAVRSEPTEAWLAERGLAVARVLLATAALAVTNLGAPGFLRSLDAADIVLMTYVAFATILVFTLLRRRSIPPRFPLIVQAADVGFTVAATQLSAASTTLAYTFVLYPLFAAAYRWGFREVMMTTGMTEVLLIASALLTGTALTSPAVVLPAILVGATGAAAGYLAEQGRRRRFEDRTIALALGRTRLAGKLGDNVNVVLAATRDAFRAKQLMLILQEPASERVLLWPSDHAVSDDHILRPEQLRGNRRDDYLFEAPGAAWHASAARFWRRGRGRFNVVAVDERGRRVPSADLTLPEGFLKDHPCRRLLGVSFKFSNEWNGRLFVVEPRLGVHREQSARFGLRLVQQIAPALFDHFLVRGMRTRAQAIERGRIARDLHDGVTQSLLGLEMEVVVLRRRAMAEAPQLVPDLARVHQIVRDEVITVRELMEGIRVGDVEAADLVHHLSDLVDRFSRHTGIVARFASEGEFVTLTPYVRRQMAGIVHEALVNVRKHSGADRVLVRSDVVDGWWKLSIEDDGRGFPFAGRLTQDELDAQHQGPRTIGERVRIIGGVMSVESRPGFGSRVEVAVPLQATE